MSPDLDSEFRLEVEDRGPAVVVRIIGSAGMNEAARMREKLLALVAQEPSVMAVDLSETEFISSLGLGAIITAHLKSRHHNGQIRLVAPRPDVQKLLETTRLTKLFAVYPTVDQALGT